jgi:putative membrane protein
MLCSILINLIRTVLSILIIKSPKKWVIITFFWFVKYKNEKVQIVTVTRNYFQRKMNILEIKIKQATGGET